MSTSSEEEVDEIEGGIRTQIRKEITSTDSREKYPPSVSSVNPIANFGQAAEVEEGKVIEATKSELETIGYGQSQEGGEVIPEKVPIQGESSWELSKRKTRSGRQVMRPY